MRDQKKAYSYALMTVVLWSTVASAFKLSLRTLTPAELLLYASIASCLVLFLIILVQGKAMQIGALQKKDWLASLKFGFLNPFLYYLILFQAYNLLPAQQAQAINYTWAITLTLLSIPLLGQKISRVDIFAITVSYIGVVIISTRGNVLAFTFESPLGVGLALFSTLIWSLYWIAHTRDRREPVIGLFLNFICSIPLIIMYILATEGFRPIQLSGLLGAVYVGGFEMGVTYVLWLKALKCSTNTAKIANLIFISPFLSLVMIHFIVGEEILPSTLVGLVFIISGLLVQSMYKKNMAKRE
jgi:drug/metabolite transporter (DMT)-like permease